MSLTGQMPDGTKVTVGLSAAVKMIDAGVNVWPTPRAHEAGPDFAKRGRSSTGMDLPAAAAETEMLREKAPWPTPTAVTLGNSLESYEAMKANMKSGPRKAITSLPQMAESVEKTAWPTPSVASAEGGQSSRSGDRKGEKLLGGLARELDRPTAWPTPTETDSSSSRRHGYMITGHPGTTLTDAADLATWATPAARDYRHPNDKPLSERGGGAKGEQLPNQAAHLYPQSTWRSPNLVDARGGTRRGQGQAQLCHQVADATAPSGPTPNGSSAPTVKRGGLNPAFVCWLMGYPTEFLSCAPLATPSSRRKRQK